MKRQSKLLDKFKRIAARCAMFVVGAIWLIAEVVKMLCETIFPRLNEGAWLQDDED